MNLFLIQNALIKVLFVIIMNLYDIFWNLYIQTSAVINKCIITNFYKTVNKNNMMNCELMLTYDTPAYMFNVYKNQLSRQTGSRNVMGPKTLPTIWHTYMKLVTIY